MHARVWCMIHTHSAIFTKCNKNPRKNFNTLFTLFGLLNGSFSREQTNENNMNLHVLNNNVVRFVVFYPNISFVSWYFLHVDKAHDT